MNLELTNLRSAVQNYLDLRDLPGLADPGRERMLLNELRRLVGRIPPIRRSVSQRAKTSLLERGS